MATESLIGNNNVEEGSSLLQRVRYCRNAATATGNVTEIRVYGHVSGNVKVALYADSSGLPGARLSYNNDSQAIVAGQWNTLSIPSVGVTQGTYYWLALASDGTAGLRGNSVGGTQYYKTITYSSYSWPDPADSGLSSNTWVFSIAGWGLVVGQQTISPSGIEQIVDYGTPQLNFTISPSGIEQLVDYGSPQLNLILYPSGIEQLIVLGTPAVQPGAVIIAPSGIEQLVALGTPTVTLMLQFVSPTGINQETALGTPKLGFILYPSGISQAIALGAPALITRQFIFPSGIAQAIVFGTPSIAMYGRICPVGIEQVIAIGSPSLLKYVWHIILDGQYITETPGINRAYIIGRDIYGNPVYGTAVDSTELGLVGERLDFQQDPAIPTTAQAGDVASAVLAKMRLTTKRGVILIPPNCGQELFDVVQVTDSLGNQTAIKFRVVGLRFEYSPKQDRYEHRLILGAP
jgi:hypothetical protein